MNNAFYAAVLFSTLAVIAPRADETNALPASIRIDGTTYEDVRWGTVTPATVTIFHKTGVATFPLEMLPSNLQKELGYDPQKAADYRAAVQKVEAAWQEARQKQLAAEAAEKQRLAFELEAERIRRAADAATQQEAVVTSKIIDDAPAEDDFFANLGPVTLLTFTQAINVKTMPNGRCSATLWYSDDAGATQLISVEFPPDGLNYLLSTKLRSTTRNGWSVYGRPYISTVQRQYRPTWTETTYWLVGMRLQVRDGNTSLVW